jgi:phenylpyruvate tautomerase PptA (4-oxalocrotonate tautomerase family)
MRRQTFFAAALLLAAAAPAVTSAQTGGAARAEHSTSVSSQGRQLDIASGTRLTAELQGTLDTSRARVGDRVVLKTTEAIKANGETVVKKGARLVGRVSDVQRRAKGAAGSSVTVVFDRLENGPLSAPVSLTVDSVTQAAARGRAGNDDFGADASAGSRASARTSGGASSGGLLGGVTDTVGSAVGGVAGATSDTVGGTVRGVGNTLGQVRVTQSTGATAEGGSTLSLSGGNLRLDKGTTFRLTFSQSVHVRSH